MLGTFKSLGLKRIHMFILDIRASHFHIAFTWSALKQAQHSDSMKCITLNGSFYHMCRHKRQLPSQSLLVKIWETIADTLDVPNDPLVCFIHYFSSIVAFFEFIKHDVTWARLPI